MHNKVVSSTLAEEGDETKMTTKTKADEIRTVLETELRVTRTIPQISLRTGISERELTEVLLQLKAEGKVRTWKEFPAGIPTSMPKLAVRVFTRVL